MSLSADLRPLLRKAMAPAAIVLGAGVATLVLARIRVIEHTEQWLYDLRLRGSPNPEFTDAIIPVPIDDDSTDHLGRWPWPRPRMAKLANDLADAGARAVLLDLTFNDVTDPAQDAEFVEIVSKATPTIAAVSALPQVPTAPMLARLSEEKRRGLLAFESRVPVALPGAAALFPDAVPAGAITPPIADFVEKGPGLALSAVLDDDDGILRRAPLLRPDLSPFAPKGAVRWIPDLPLALACRWYGVAPAAIRVEPGAIVLPGARAPGDAAPHDVRIPVDASASLLVDYARPGVLGSRFVSARDMIAGLAAADPRARPRVKDRIVLVYPSHTGSGDLHATPLSTAYPGGLWNAEVLNTILTGRFVRVPPPSLPWILALVEGVLLVAFAVRWTSYRLSGAVFAVLFVLLVIGFGLYRAAHLMIPLAAPAYFAAMGGAAVVFWKTFLEDRERIDLLFTMRALQNQALKERRRAEENPTTLQGSTGAATSDAEMALKRNVEYGRFIESLRDISSLENTYIGKHYRLLNLIDEGGMGLVFRAYDEALERTVAIKVLTRYSAKLVKRFQTEARAVGQLQHPNVVQVFAVASEGDIPYIVMEYVHGTSLSQRIRDDGPLPVVPALEVILQVARGLDAAHLRHIIHRDIKTSNILLMADGTAKIIDFGIAKFFKQSGEGLTGEKEIVGTADYMSPEQGSGKPVDHRSDVYSLGITLYRVLTGRLPFRAEDTVAVLLKQIKEPLPDIREARRDVPDEVIRILTKMTEKKPADRYQSCAELCADLEAFLHRLRAQEPTVAAKL